jgi:FkbM family methyltransferase
MLKLLKIILLKTSYFAIFLAEKIRFTSVKVIEKKSNIWTVQLSDKRIYKLHKGEHVDDQIIQYGIFEPHSTKIVKSILHQGMTVLDVGANFGYYSCLFSKLVGIEGSVYCFEPTNFFRNRLNENLIANNFNNVYVSEFALSDTLENITITISGDTASCHWVPDFDKTSTSVITTEMIKAIPLDEFLLNKNINNIDLIKVDIDGHEIKFIKGAFNTIKKYQPKILMEVSPIHLHEAGFSLVDCWNIIQDIRYDIFHENELYLISTFREFLYRCGNYNESINILLVPKTI